MKKIVFLVIILATIFFAKAQSPTLYGTASKGGLYGGGSIYKYDVATATKSDVYDFSKINEIDNYANYFCELNGKLYATAGGNGFGRFNQGLLYEYNPITNTYTTLYHFGDSVTGEAGINGGKVMASLTILNGKLYGATSAGGASNLGVLFEFDPATNVYTKLKDLTVSYGNPNSPLILASDGNFYGTTKSNGTSGITPVNGVIYKYNLATNTLSVVAGFPTDAINGLVNCSSINQAANGKLYGIAEASGGTNSAVFECDIATNTITKKASFGATTLLLGGNTILYDGKNGNFYCYLTGTNGSIFEYNIASSAITTKYTFSTTSGQLWVGAGINPTTGTFYGHTLRSTANPYGEIFEYNYNTNTYSVAIAYTISGSIYGSGNIFFASNNKAYSFCSYKPGIIAQLNIQEIDFAAKTSTYKLDANVSSFGYYPSGNLLKASDGKLYGTTIYGASNNSGCLFSFDPATNTLVNIQNFYQNMGTKPNENLVEVGGKIYGTTNGGGIGATGGTAGVLFEYTIATNIYVVKKTFTNLPATGYRPIYGLLVGKNGKLYGQTETSTSGGNAIFEYNITANTLNWVYTFPAAVGSYNGALSEDLSGVFYTYDGFGLSKIDINTNTQTRVSLLGGTTTGTNGTGKPLIYNNAVYCSVGPCIAKYDIATATTSTNCNGFTSIGTPVLGGIILASNNKLYYNSLTYPSFSSGGVSGNGWLGQVYELDSNTLATNSLCNLEASMGYYPLAALTDTTFPSLAIKNNFLSNNFKIYPNPSNGIFNIEVDENLIDAKATIYNLLGQKIKDFKLNSTTTNQYLNKGIYLLEIEKSGIKTSKKLIVN